MVKTKTSQTDQDSLWSIKARDQSPRSPHLQWTADKTLTRTPLSRKSQKSQNKSIVSNAKSLFHTDSSSKVLQIDEYIKQNIFFCEFLQNGLDPIVPNYLHPQDSTLFSK